MASTKIQIPTLLKKKCEGEKITMITAYDYPTARILDESGVDTILVGDSLSNVVLGYEGTVPVTMDEMLHHIKAVTRAVKRAHVIGDMPFGSYNVSKEQAIINATRIFKEGGTDSIKLEGGARVADSVEAIVRAGIPVVGHLGLTPQTSCMLGGFRVQGATAEKAQEIIDDAKKLEDAGSFMIVLECIPSQVAEAVAKSVSIPIIGIGAGNKTDGQVLVFHDLIGIESGYAPRFVKQYAKAESIIKDAVKQYIDEVTDSTFPGEDHSFSMKPEELDKLQKNR